MLAVLARNIKRFLILVPGLVIGYFAYTDLFPAFNRWLPGEVALIITYILAAYILIPVGARIFRIVIQPKHVPLYSTTPDGLASDPLNMGIIGSERQLTRAMKKAGWYKADERTPKTIARLIVNIVLRRPYKNAPFSNLYLFGRKQDVGFELPLNHDPSNRHHVRFWAASHTSDPRHLENLRFWERFHKPNFARRSTLWVGAASRDVGLGIIRHNAQITHMIHPDTNAERDLIVRHLKKTGLVKKVRTEKIGEPYRLTNRVLTGYLHADGKMTICEL